MNQIKKDKKITMNLDVKTLENCNLKTIWFSSERKIDRKQNTKTTEKKTKEKKKNTYNMAVTRFFGKNKEIFMPSQFVDTRFPYFFLVLCRGFAVKKTLCSKYNPMVLIPETLWFFLGFY